MNGENEFLVDRPCSEELYRALRSHQSRFPQRIDRVCSRGKLLLYISQIDHFKIEASRSNETSELGLAA